MEEGQGGSPLAAAAAAGVWDGSGDSGGVAVVVDAETTSYLMMGALSPGGAQQSNTKLDLCYYNDYYQKHLILLPVEKCCSCCL
jgi:hypothetical protein